jgi:hypothetical protein
MLYVKSKDNKFAENIGKHAFLVRGVVKIYNRYMLYDMAEKQIHEIEKQIGKIKKQLIEIGEMRPGSLTKQYRDPKKKIGPFYQLSYTHKMKSRTDYVRPIFVKEIRRQIANYKLFKKLTEKWVELSIKHSKLKIDIAKNEKAN